MSTPLGGFTRPTVGKSQQNIVQEIVDWLDTRRALSDELELEAEYFLNHGIINIRDHLADELPRLDRDDFARAVLKDWIDECNAHLTYFPDPDPSRRGLRPQAADSLMKVREHFIVGLNELAEEYDVPEARALAAKIENGTW